MDGLPGGSLDELQLGDVRLATPAIASFSLTNRSEGKHFRWALRALTVLGLSLASGVCF
jgi:hypothetical protein